MYAEVEIKDNNNNNNYAQSQHVGFALERLAFFL